MLTKEKTVAGGFAGGRLNAECFTEGRLNAECRKLCRRQAGNDGQVCGLHNLIILLLDEKGEKNVI